jgi:orotidine-5'-phosphate decarboxylase
MSEQAGFFERLGERIAAVDSVVSVGLDPDPSRIPEFPGADLPRWAFNRRVIDATHEHAAAYKPNAAFYEDADGWRALRETVAYANGKDVPVLLDAKRADIGNTARQYARLLDEPGADAITVNPYLGGDSLQPFLERDAGVFVLCRTSNPGGADLQDLELADGDTVYERVADLAADWDDHGTVGLVVGATAPEELEAIRERVPDLPFLVPGVGAQGGDARAAVEFGLADGVGLVNSSRGVIFAGEERVGRRPTLAADGDGEREYFRAAGEAARQLQERLSEHR